MSLCRTPPESNRTERPEAQGQIRLGDTAFQHPEGSNNNNPDTPKNIREYAVHNIEQLSNDELFNPIKSLKEIYNKRNVTAVL